MSKFQKTKATLYIQTWKNASENALGEKFRDTFAKRDALTYITQRKPPSEIKFEHGQINMNMIMIFMIYDNLTVQG